ncbi:tetratricopeptide repeat-containing sensor histidine kinase [Flexithrix dorotheae]|uniref:tetratricopeptide repeat-containing sensor histidine kinase n=1 Tax=Flexithrix dorotheae TaxID=70993 RepID=UPI0003A6B041|nr:tetratricopeptide repeat protein [Flexithrix dorotheae]
MKIRSFLFFLFLPSLVLGKVEEPGIGDLYSKAWSIRNDFPDSAISLATSGKHLAIEKGDLFGQANGCGILGALFESKKDFENAVRNYELEEELYAQLHNWNKQASSLNRLGVLYKNYNNYEKSLSSFYKAMTLCDEHNLLSTKSKVLNNLGGLNTALEEYNSAIENYREACKIKEEVKDTLGMAKALNNMGITFISLEKYDSALYYFNESKEFFTTLEHKEMLGMVQNNIGLVLLEQGKFDQAKISLEKSLVSYNYPNNEEEGFSPLNNLGEVSRLKGEYKQAFLFFYRAKAIAEKYPLKEKKADLFENLAKTHEAMGILDSALFYQRAFTSLRNELINEDKNRTIANLKIQYEVDKKDQQLQLLGAQASLQALKLNSMIIILIVVIVGAFFGFRYYHQRMELSLQTVNVLLQDQEIKSKDAMMEGQQVERQRIAEDLHDRLGGLLATVKLNFQALEDKILDIQVENRNQYVKTNRLLDEAYEEVRAVSHNLVSGSLTKYGLKSALEDLRDTIREARGIEFDFLTYGFDNRLSTKIEISLYKTIQELVNNILKYAKATKVTIQINQYPDGSLNIMVEDNGLGFDVEKAQKKGGLGLHNIQRRVTSLNGTLDIDSAKGRGTTVIIDLPASACIG